MNIKDENIQPLAYSICEFRDQLEDDSLTLLGYFL